VSDGTKYADLILPVPLQQVFTYHLPDELKDRVNPGCRVVVQFGNRKLYSGLVKRTHYEKPTYDTKPIELLLDELPIIEPVVFSFWEWIAAYYLSSEGEVMKAALPAGLKLESQTHIKPSNECTDEEQLTPTEETVFQFVSIQKSATIQQINSLTKRANAYPVIQSLLQKGAIVVEEKVAERYRPKTVAHVRVNPAINETAAMENAFGKLKKNSKQLELIMLLLYELSFFSTKPKTSVPKKELLIKANCTEGVLKSLEKKGMIELFDLETDRLPDSDSSKKATPLNNFQEKALNDIYASFRDKDVTLLHGITASGKTEVYIRMIKEQLKAGKQVLYLLPEIALTSQIIDRLTAVFGSVAGVYHSKLSDAERVEIWNKVVAIDNDGQSKFQLILGARSALFLPYSKLGLIIVDEEHETSFKQFDPAPRYNARDCAVVLAKLHHAKLLMGTATPSFETYFNAMSRKYGYVQLTQRHHDVQLPEIVVADTIDAHKRKLMKSHFTPALFNEMQTALNNNEQIILFQNRRGFSPFVQCRACGHIPKCTHCDVSLTYHKYHNNLQCHYCGYTTSLHQQCPTCGSPDVQTKGFGTEKIEDELKIFFPDIKIGRLDYDASRTKHGYEKVINDFSSGKTRILVGTQMVAKGLDFDHVSLVGILNADNLLNYPDFRSYERAFQLMSQVSGRAGRKNKNGKVVIQTAQPDHPVIKFVINHDYEGFFKEYIGERKLFKYPPWCRLVYLTVKHKNNERAQTSARQLAAELIKKFGNRVMGPEFHLISRLQQYYQLVIRIKLERELSPATAKYEIRAAIDKVKTFENNSGVIISADVDPY
jgi:primosomal protein N' (replication factor Y) (superfamily II helicase)